MDLWSAPEQLKVCQLNLGRLRAPGGGGVGQGPWDPWDLSLGALRISGWRGLVAGLTSCG